MLRTLNICSSCRQNLFQRSGPEEWIRTGHHVVRRHRSTKGSSKKQPKSKSLLDGLLDDLKPFEKSPPPLRPHAEKRSNRHDRFSKFPPRKAVPPSTPREEGSVFLPLSNKNTIIPNLAPGEVIPHFETQVYSWASSARTRDRLQSFGIPPQDAVRLLDAFVEDVESGMLSDPDSITYYGLERFTHPHDATSVDAIYSTIFFSWASHPENEVILEDEFHVDPKTMHYLKRLVKATSRPHPADEWPEARILNRKVIMHVGPTNSGKTHHALRALAAAKSGVYAGPLRLLAYEIWHRLNTGQIVPLGVEEDPNEPRSSDGNPKYAKLCDMLTGEEQRIMSEGTPLKSCTVEMISFAHKYEVAVIDEIQMINDRNRGGGWVNAVLGVSAQEVHLCGEESAVPVVEALLRHTGDEVEIRRYERLTPLVVEKESLDGDLAKVREGDCIVAFSRSRIFNLKKVVEEKTGMRCAVIYGRLPPEVRSEQAALFNDPHSGYEVLIGSDAIGMGLNLRIKRVIFEAMHKRDQSGKHLLSQSSIKQIGGRAGRYGVHKSQANLGGFVTTLFPEDLRHLARWINAPYEPLPYVTLALTPELLQSTLSILPAGSSISLALLAPKYIGRIPSFMRYEVQDHLDRVAPFLDQEWSEMSIEDKVLILHAPIPWQDGTAVEVIKKMLILHAEEFCVDIEACIEGTKFMETLESIEEKMELGEQTGVKFSTQTNTLMLMESFHKVLVFYVWMSFKNSVVYSDESVFELKQRSEKVLNWTLEHMSKDKKKPAAESLPSPTDADAAEKGDGLEKELTKEELPEEELVEDETEIR